MCCCLNDNHDMCVLHYINGVNSRTKMPMVVPISTREPKQTVNQSVVTPLMRTVDVESTNQKPKSIIRKQYEQIIKTCRWWYCKITPPGYKWKPKSRTVNVEPNVSMHLRTKSRTTNISKPTTLRKSTVSNTPSSSNYFAACRDNFIHHQPWVLKAHDRKSQASKRTRKKKLCKADIEGPAFNLVKAFHKNNVFLQFQMDECHKLLTNKVDLVNPEGHQILRNIYEPLPLGGPPGQVTIQLQFFFNKDLDYLLIGDKERNIALSISKLKAARYLDFGLEELVPSLWVESERDYDISAAYGITHWWFRRKEFYINKHSEPSDREAVRSQMRILSVISVKVYEKYGYNYLREIILRRADYKEYKISEKDFKNLHPNDFEDLFLLNIQEKLNHLPKTDKTSLHTAVNMWIRNLVIRNRVGDLQLGIESYQTKINLERPNWDAADYYFKEDYTIVPKPRAVVYRDRNDQRKLMRLNELHKFSDGTLTRVMEKLDHMVKDFHLFEYNKGMETRKWSEDDKRRSKDFITAIEKRLQIRRIFRSLESFVGGRIRDIDYRLINRTT
ncbi:hypothetical protein Tco_0097358 [Tanacetum coccineum]